jgi:hypothetical protein
MRFLRMCWIVIGMTGGVFIRRLLELERWRAPLIGFKRETTDSWASDARSRHVDMEGR